MSTLLNVLIANERFLGRFGVDRILLLLARYLADQGMAVSFAYLRADQTALHLISPSIFPIVLPDGKGLVDADHHVADVLADCWMREAPDVLVMGGWPFFKAAAQAATFGVRSLFIDAGAVPHDGLSEPGLSGQRELRRLRQQWLPFIDLVAPISDFIRESQTEPDRGHTRGVVTVRLGSDHLLAQASDRGAEDVASTLMQLEVLNEAPLIFLLGRYEVEGYKNSPATFELLRMIRNSTPNAGLVMLVGDERVETPPDLSSAIVQLATISDEALQAVMERSRLGVSLSLWEGFNLPIVEMQALERPVLAFNVGAHVEVIADPWMLCDSLQEMAIKAVRVLNEGLPPRDRFEAVRRRLCWSETLHRWTDLVRDGERLDPGLARRMVLIDVTNAARDAANSGVIRVSRRLSAELEARDDLDVVLVRWDQFERCYSLVAMDGEQHLSRNAGPKDWVGRLANSGQSDVGLADVLASRPPDRSGAILFLPETILDGAGEERVVWARKQGFGVAAILYDLLPVYHAKYVSKAVCEAFPSYLKMLSTTDGLWSISSFSHAEFERYIADHDMRRPPTTETVWLPGQFSNLARVTQRPQSILAIRAICVSTIEPRKNHRVLIDAFRGLLRRRPELDISLTLIGNRYAGADELADYVEEIGRAEKRIVWHGPITDTEIATEYDSAAFSIYPSLVEGFGLPILESLWMGCPCICNNDGVMAELAEAGGCLTVDMTDEAALSSAIECLATDESLRSSLRQQARSRPIAGWDDYADAIAELLLHLEQRSPES